MNVTRDVIRDLLPLVLAGEASADSRALVEGFLAQDPELARAAAKEPGRLAAADIPSTLTQEDEMKTIVKTRRLVRKQSVLLACAILFTLLPVSFASDAHGTRWIWADAPLGAALVAGLGLACWAMYFWTRRTLRAHGL